MSTRVNSNTWLCIYPTISLVILITIIIIELSDRRNVYSDDRDIGFTVILQNYKEKNIYWVFCVVSDKNKYAFT